MMERFFPLEIADATSNGKIFSVRVLLVKFVCKGINTPCRRYQWFSCQNFMQEAMKRLLLRFSFADKISIKSTSSCWRENWTLTCPLGESLFLPAPALAPP